MSGEKYEIKNVWDFAKVPDDRLDFCLQEFGEAVRMTRASLALLDAIADEKEIAPEVRPLFVLTDTFTWVDDDKGERSLTVHFPDSPSVEISVSPNQEPAPE